MTFNMGVRVYKVNKVIKNFIYFFLVNFSRILTQMHYFSFLSKFSLVHATKLVIYLYSSFGLADLINKKLIHLT